ncbi:MAG TPA: phospholipase D family protein [Bacteroidia bacterium]|nr:phospholipase D family protein [Bacteroidia bacterium]
MEQFILKEKLKEQIGNRKVIAALFYTFNFDPKFFENYIMPLLIPKEKSEKFRDEVIHNKILWRQYIKGDIIPPTAVFCDYFAKDNTEAPSLGYDIHCIKTPAAQGKICNFHPKHIFLLVEDDSNTSLIVVTGSGNITPSGWCDNIECFSLEEYKKNKTFPNKTTTNVFQDIISQTGKLANLKYFLPAEELIHDFLKYVDYEFQYFNSTVISFEDFITDNIILRDTISEIEIVSPYFSNDTKLVSLLKSKEIKTIKCLVPTLKDNEIQINKETFNTLNEAGLKWSFWSDSKINKEVRNLHAKIYRFHGEKYTHTIIGSVNFTNPAWKKFELKNNEANIESAYLYKEKTGIKILKEAKNIDFSTYNFIAKESLENQIENLFNRNPPDLSFEIDWKNKLIKYEGKKINSECFFTSLLDKKLVTTGKHEYTLNSQDLKSLSKNSLIEVTLINNGNTEYYSFYPTQLNFEFKPLDFKIDASTILKYWQFLEDEFQKEGLLSLLIERITDESGIVHEDRIEKVSILNEMATHFSALIKLEEFLFYKKLTSKTAQKEHFSFLKYYLLSENIDTIPFYLADIENQFQNNKIYKTFYWMILQIIITNFYLKAEKWDFKKEIDSKDWNIFKTDIKQKQETLSILAKNISKELSDENINQKLEWVIEKLKENHE